MLARARGELLVERERRDRAGRVVRVADPEERDLVPGVERVEIRQPAVRSSRSGTRHDLAAGEERAALVDRIAPAPGSRRAASRRARSARTRRSPPSSRASARSRSPGRRATPKRRSIQPAIAVAQLGQAGRARVGRDRLDRREQRLADERRRHLARVAHAEVDQRRCRARARLGLPVVEARERVLRELGEDGESCTPRQTLPSEEALQRVEGPRRARRSRPARRRRARSASRPGRN